MLKTERRTVTTIVDGKPVDEEIEEPVLERRSGEPIVTEDRTPGPFRALPREYRDRILGNPQKQVVGYVDSQKWNPLYQTYEQGLLIGVRCWKCRRDLVSWMPALRKAPTKDNALNAEQIYINGQPAVKITPYNHYREGLYAYRRPDGIEATFSYLHCADCTIADADGPDLLACLLAGHDYTRTAFNLYDDHFWAQWMWRWSAIELVARSGASKGPEDLMKEALRKGR